MKQITSRCTISVYDYYSLIKILTVYFTLKKVCYHMCDGNKELNLENT